jgi:hypothetical protein
MSKQKVQGYPVRDENGNLTGDIYVPDRNELVSFRDFDRKYAYGSKVSVSSSLFTDSNEIEDDLEHRSCTGLRDLMHQRFRKGKDVSADYTGFPVEDKDHPRYTYEPPPVGVRVVVGTIKLVGKIFGIGRKK